MTETDENDYQNPLTINSTLIKKEEQKKYGNRFIEDYTYEISGDNGIFEIVPKIVKFAGFEINKKHKVKVQIINKSKFSENLTLIPPTTPFFKIKFSGNGMIPSGLSKSITIVFLPNKYQYYYDFLRVFCQGKKMQIPIHAYPKMNINLKEYVPKRIDFGVVGINSTDHREIKLDNLIPMTFEYEIIPLKTCEEITVEPIMGEIEAESFKNIYLKFSPSSYGIFTSEYEFKHSEYDYKNIIVQVSGSCNTFDKVLHGDLIPKIRKSPKKYPMNSKDSISSQTPNLLQSIKAVSAKSKTKNLGLEKSSNEDNINNQSVSSISKDKGISKKFKIFPSNKEREFLNYFNKVDGLINDKEIKYIRFIGKKLLTDEETNKIVNDRIADYENNLQMRRKVDINRHSLEVDTDICTIDPNHKFYIKPAFDFNSNDKFFKKRHYFKIFLNYMTSVVVRARAEKRSMCLKNMITKNNIKSSSDFGEYVEKDWNQYLTQDNESDEYKIKLKFTKPKNITRKPLYISYDYNLESLKQNISHENNIQFDELKEYQYLDKSDLEVMNYKEFKSTGLTMYEISTKEKILRSGAESEGYIRGERGDSEMEYNNIQKLIEMPATMRNHIETNTDTLLFSNPGLKKYAPYESFNESAIEYNLQPRNLNMGYNKESHYSHFAYDMTLKLPFSIYEFIPNRDLDNSCMVCDNSLDKVPERIEVADPKDFFIKKGEKIDDDNYLFNQLKEDDNKLLEAFEMGDEVIKKVREINKDDVYDFKLINEHNLEYNHSIQKRKWMATIPSVLEYYNNSIVNPNNKIIL